jgi:hypothetical protein
MFYLLCEAGAVLLYKIIRRGLCYIYTYVIYIYTRYKNVWNFLQTSKLRWCKVSLQAARWVLKSLFELCYLAESAIFIKVFVTNHFIRTVCTSSNFVLFSKKCYSRGRRPRCYSTYCRLFSKYILFDNLNILLLIFYKFWIIFHLLHRENLNKDLVLVLELVLGRIPYYTSVRSFSRSSDISFFLFMVNNFVL